MSDVSRKGSSAGNRSLSRKTFEPPTFLGEAVPAEFAARLSARGSGAGLGSARAQGDKRADLA